MSTGVPVHDSLLSCRQKCSSNVNGPVTNINFRGWIGCRNNVYCAVQSCTRSMLVDIADLEVIFKWGHTS